MSPVFFPIIQKLGLLFPFLCPKALIIMSQTIVQYLLYLFKILEKIVLNSIRTPPQLRLALRTAAAILLNIKPSYENTSPPTTYTSAIVERIQRCFFCALTYRLNNPHLSPWPLPSKRFLNLPSLVGRRQSLRPGADLRYFNARQITPVRR